MGFDKSVETRIFGVTVQDSDLRMTAGDSTGGTFTGRNNPLRGSLFWDDCSFVLNDVVVAGGATGGSYTVTIQTDAIIGYTGMPIASATLGPNSDPDGVVMDNLHQSPSSPLPTHIFIDQTAAGGAINLQCHVQSKQYRGTLGTAGQGTAERVLQGNMIQGNSSTVDFSGDEGISENTTFTIGTSGSNVGMNRIRLWDHALYWVVAGNTIAGTHDVDIIGVRGGTTYSIATTGTGGALDVADEKVAIANQLYGQSPNPSAIIWTEASAGGVSDFRVVMMAKTGRGSLAKR